MQKETVSRSFRARWAALIALLMTCVLVGCDSPQPKKEEKKDNRTSQEKVVILKQRFEQLESSLNDMENDLKVQRKRIESTRELADAIRHSLTKGGLQGYNLDNVSTTDPLVLAAIEEKRQEREDEKNRSDEKEDTDDDILNGLLIVVFLIMIGSLFWVALHDRKTDNQPLEAGVGGAYVPEEEQQPDPVDPYDPEITPGIDDTGSYQYGELGPQRSEDKRPPETDENPGEDRPQ